ncbi:hypothetical protein LIA77_07530 [Sarocladium implicatum]|nr:hypothetical protein LIA77_07530 [Sarocladium implicatum]
MLLRLSVMSAFIAGLSAAEDQFPGPIAGCDEVSCPITSAGAYDTCRVADDTFQGIGLVRIGGLPSALSGLSIVKGAGVPGADASDISSASSDNDDEKREFNSVYYLASPLSGSDASLSGCAAVFHDTDGGLKFDGSDIQSSTGQCKDVIATECIDALRKIANDAAKESHSCDSLSKKLSEARIDSCKDFAGEGRGLGRFTTTNLSDLSSISGQRNQSSDCWPVLPKNSSLSYFDDDVTTVRTHGNYSYEALIPNLYKITPILTLFKGSADDDGPSSSLSCVKLVTTRNLLRPSADDGDDEGGAGVGSWSFGAAVVAVAADTCVNESRDIDQKPLFNLVCRCATQRDALVMRKSPSLDESVERKSATGLEMETDESCFHPWYLP